MPFCSLRFVFWSSKTVSCTLLERGSVLMAKQVGGVLFRRRCLCMSVLPCSKLIICSSSRSNFVRDSQLDLHGGTKEGGVQASVHSAKSVQKDVEMNRWMIPALEVVHLVYVNEPLLAVLESDADQNAAASCNRLMARVSGPYNIVAVRNKTLT